MKTINKYTVLRDTREQDGWDFPETSYCDGTIITKLDTGDYSLLGLEDKFCIERKGSVSEFSQNIVQDRFEKELTRMDSFEHSFLVLEFDYRDLLLFPSNSGIPRHLWKKIRITSAFLRKRLTEIELYHKTKIVFVGNDGLEKAEDLFKYIFQYYNQ